MLASFHSLRVFWVRARMICSLCVLCLHTTHRKTQFLVLPSRIPSWPYYNMNLSSQSSSKLSHLLPLFNQPCLKSKKPQFAPSPALLVPPCPSTPQGDAHGWMLAPMWRIPVELRAPDLQESSWAQRCQHSNITLQREVIKESITAPSSENGTVL